MALMFKFYLLCFNTKSIVYIIISYFNRLHQWNISDSFRIKRATSHTILLYTENFCLGTIIECTTWWIYIAKYTHAACEFELEILLFSKNT